MAEYLSKAASDFEIKLEDTDTVNGTKNYYLYVSGEKCYPVDYNVYASLDSEGNTNVKTNYESDCVKEKRYYGYYSAFRPYYGRQKDVIK